MIHNVRAMEKAASADWSPGRHELQIHVTKLASAFSTYQIARTFHIGNEKYKKIKSVYFIYAQTLFPSHISLEWSNYVAKWIFEI